MKGAHALSSCHPAAVKAPADICRKCNLGGTKLVGFMALCLILYMFTMWCGKGRGASCLLQKMADFERGDLLVLVVSCGRHL